MCKKVKDHYIPKYMKNDWLAKKGGRRWKRDCEAAFREYMQNAIKVGFYTEITEVGSDVGSTEKQTDIKIVVPTYPIWVFSKMLTYILPIQSAFCNCP